MQGIENKKAFLNGLPVERTSQERACRGKGELTRGKVELTFKKISNIEDEIGKDVCTMNKEECAQVLNVTSSSNLPVMRVHKKMLDHYCEWCLENNVKDANSNMINMDIDKNAAVFINVFMCPEDLAGYLDASYAPVEMESTELVMRGIFWLVYIGIPRHRLMDVKESDVNLENKTITFDGIEYRIPREAMETIRLLKELDSFVGTRYTSKGFIVRVYNRIPRTDGDELLRGSQPRTADTNKWAGSVTSRVSKRRKSCQEYCGDRELNLRSARIGGKYWRIYKNSGDGTSTHLEKESIEKEVAFDDSVAEDIGKPVLSCEFNFARRSYTMSRRYLMWKQAYQNLDI